jgi:hypothetical protein
MARFKTSDTPLPGLVEGIEQRGCLTRLDRDTTVVTVAAG